MMTAAASITMAGRVTYIAMNWLSVSGEFTPAGVNSPETLNQFMAMYVTLPAIVMLAAAVIMWRFPLDREAQHDLRRRIEERDGHHASHDASDAAAAVTQVGTSSGIVDRPAE